VLEALETASKETGLEANADKIKYLVISRDQLWCHILSLKVVITLKPVFAAKEIRLE